MQTVYLIWTCVHSLFEFSTCVCFFLTRTVSTESLTEDTGMQLCVKIRSHEFTFSDATYASLSEKSPNIFIKNYKKVRI